MQRDDEKVNSEFLGGTAMDDIRVANGIREQFSEGSKPATSKDCVQFMTVNKISCEVVNWKSVRVWGCLCNLYAPLVHTAEVQAMLNAVQSLHWTFAAC